MRLELVIILNNLHLKNTIFLFPKFHQILRFRWKGSGWRENNRCGGEVDRLKKNDKKSCRISKNAYFSEHQFRNFIGEIISTWKKKSLKLPKLSYSFANKKRSLKHHATVVAILIKFFFRIKKKKKVILSPSVFIFCKEEKRLLRYSANVFIKYRLPGRRFVNSARVQSTHKLETFLYGLHCGGPKR